MNDGILSDMWAVDPLLRQKHPAPFRVLADGHDAGNDAVRALAPGDTRHVLSVGDLIATVWRVIIIQKIEIGVVAYQPRPGTLHQTDVRIQQILDRIDEAAVAQADPAGNVGSENAVIRGKQRLPHFG